MLPIYVMNANKNICHVYWGLFDCVSQKPINSHDYYAISDQLIHFFSNTRISIAINNLDVNLINESE